MARKTKKDIYADYGIVYDPKTNKILSPIGEWIPVLIPVDSNTKVGKAGTWSILHGNENHDISEYNEKTQCMMKSYNVEMVKGSCPFHCDNCYCDKGNYNYPDVKMSSIRKLIFATYYREWLQNAIIAQIKADKIPQVRIHAQGDFFCESYVDMWIAICKACDNVIFWTYTKYDYALKMFRNVKNLSIVHSMTVKGINFGHCDYILRLYHELTAMGYRVHICGCGTPYENHCDKCNVGCKAIGKDCDYVLFIEHSGSYKAGKKDPDDFAKVIAIIAKQVN